MMLMIISPDLPRGQLGGWGGVIIIIIIIIIIINMLMPAYQ